MNICEMIHTGELSNSEIVDKANISMSTVIKYKKMINDAISNNEPIPEYRVYQASEPPPDPSPNDEEIWKDCLPDSRYQVSTLGRVKSKDKEFIGSNGSKCLYPGKILNQSDPGRNYRQVALSGILHRVHKLVLETFVGPRPSDKHTCNHKNGIHSDNRLCNLEWVTHSENVQHAFKILGLKHDTKKDKLPHKELCMEVYKLNTEGMLQQDIAVNLSINIATVSHYYNDAKQFIKNNDIPEKYKEYVLNHKTKAQQFLKQCLDNYKYIIRNNLSQRKAAEVLNLGHGCIKGRLKTIRGYLMEEGWIDPMTKRLIKDVDLDDIVI